MFSLGFVFFNAEGVARNLPRAADLYLSAAEQGHGKAATTLAYMHYHGDGVPRDFWRAASLAEKGAAQVRSDRRIDR
jgi:TPR repeat protein